MSDGKKMAGALDWKSVATWQHLFAATMAAHDLKVSTISSCQIRRLHMLSASSPPLFYSDQLHLSDITTAQVQ
jgi:hypothetical protein